MAFILYYSVHLILMLQLLYSQEWISKNFRLNKLSPIKLITQLHVPSRHPKSHEEKNHSKEVCKRTGARAIAMDPHLRTEIE